MMSMPLIVNCIHSLTVACGDISVLEKTLKNTVSSRERRIGYSMAVTGEETEPGMAVYV